MFRCRQLKQEAAQLRGRIDPEACLLRQRVDNLMQSLRALARRPAALPIAFVCGLLVERLHLSGIKRVFGLLAGQVKTLQIVSSLISSYPAR